jgi:pimeloyl-ACP methyl ester carboxylesterase
VADLAALLDALSLKKVLLVGHDWGAAVCWKFSMRHPECVDRYVAVSVGHPTAGDGYFESRDGDVTWRRSERCLRHRYLWSLAVDRGDPETIVLSAASSARASHGELAESHLYRRTANSAWKEIRNSSLSPIGRGTAGLSAHPNEPGWFYAVWENDVFYSIDGGVDWEKLEFGWPNEFCLPRLRVDRRGRLFFSASAMPDVSSIQNLMTVKRRSGLSSEKRVNRVLAASPSPNSTGLILGESPSRQFARKEGGARHSFRSIV